MNRRLRMKYVASRCRWRMGRETRIPAIEPWDCRVAARSDFELCRLRLSPAKRPNRRPPK
jgi:hypothetical protein